MHARGSRVSRLGLGIVLGALLAGSLATPAGAKTKLIKPVWLKGYAAPGTPKSLDKVGIIKIGSSKAKNVLVLEPGTSAAAPYFVPLAKWLVELAPEWQVWSVERRENLLKNEKELDLLKEGKVTGTELFDYYLGYLEGAGGKKHYEPVEGPKAAKDGAKEWGMNVAVEDLHVVIEAAKKLGGKVVLGGHSLGGSVVTAYATWDFGGKPGADGLSGLVYIDGGSGPTGITAAEAEEKLAKINPESPWLAFGGIPAPDLGLFSLTGSALTVYAGNEASSAETFKFLPPDLVAKNEKGEKVKVTNEAEFGYGVNWKTSPESLAAAQVHAGEGIKEPAMGSEPWTWNGTGAITPLKRYAEMLAGAGINGDGTEWYFPERLTLDTGAVADGNENPAQKVLDEHAIYGHSLPTSLRILAISTELDKLLGAGFSTLTAAEVLAEQSGIPKENLTLIDEEDAYSHNDPNGAYPNNALVEDLNPLLKELAK